MAHMLKRPSLTPALVSLLVTVFLVASAILPAHAVEPDEILSDPALEQRARDLSGALRCMVCQNQSIDDSDAPLAKDLRLLVRERLQQGDSDRDVLDYVVDRYGEFVLLEPRFGWHTIALWLTIPLVLLGGGVLSYRTLRSMGQKEAGEAGLSLTRDEEERLERLLSETDPSGGKTSRDEDQAASS